MSVGALIGWGFAVFALGLICGWFACSHADELVNFEEKEYLAIVHQIYVGHGADHTMRDNLLKELDTYRYDIYQERGELSNELQLMIKRAGL